MQNLLCLFNLNINIKIQKFYLCIIDVYEIILN